MEECTNSYADLSDGLSCMYHVGGLSMAVAFAFGPKQPKTCTGPSEVCDVL